MGKWLLSQILAFLGWTLAALFRLVDYLTYDMVSGKSWVKPFAADAAPSATEGAHGCYIEDDRTRDLREAYASRRRGHRSKREIEDLIKNVGRN